MKKKHYSSSSDTDSDTPLVKSRSRSREFRENDLYKWSIERCEFCDAVYYNKYNIMVHNATHIIIPLLQQKIHECPKCYFHFTSETSLEEHMVMKHLNITNKEDFTPDLIKNIITSEPHTVLIKEPFVKIDTKAGVNERNDILQSLVLKQPFTVLTKETFLLGQDTKEKVTDTLVSESKLLESFVNKQAITVLNPLVVKEEVEIINISDSDSSIFDNENSNSVDSFSKINSIKDRILFEDDNDDDILNLNEPNDLNLVNGSNIQNLVTNVKSNTIILGKYPRDDTKYESVHYDELTKPGLFKCKRCYLSFPNRYELIVHETNYMSIRKRLPFLCRMCDWYVANNRWGLKAHQMAKHPDKTVPTTAPTRCRKCNLAYIYYYRHLRNYHNTYVCRYSKCMLTFDNKRDYKSHECANKSWKEEKIVNDERNIITSLSGDQWYSKNVHVCDLCKSFFKDTLNRHYKYIGSISKAGVRMKCKRCRNKFFELNIVNAQSRCNVGYVHQEKKKVTNEERLKNVQQRLKKLKFLNKF
ncbi:unnamed protein product [Chilo suppressalis]|uniref:C2H2-type domain-containing protein n=1 Tax=Chilo suppressalis TaxID=168631 RepID=A0ABN8B9J4_CHISP|nr:unnamed protein product [Chilo suppressalis]